MPDAIVVTDVYKRFGDIQALCGLPLSVKEGEIYGLLGPNGAGKSTLIRSIIGLVRPDRGQVLALGRAMPSKSVLARMGYMTQVSALYDDLTVWQNVAFFAAMAGCRDKGAITLLFTVYVVDIHYAGSLLVVFIVEALLAVAAVNLGIFLSAFARNEFQVLQFIPPGSDDTGSLGWCHLGGAGHAHLAATVRLAHASHPR